MYKQLKQINKKPKAFECYTADSLWTDPYRSKQMLKYHLNKDIDLASRNKNFIDNSIKWIISNFNIDNNSKICDFGCAIGLYTTPLAKTGAKVTGIDFSKNSLEYAKDIAKKQNLDINYIDKNYLEYKSDEKYNLITMIMCDFCVLSPIQRKTLLDKFYNLLDKDGKVLLDVSSLKAFKQIKEDASYEQNQLNSFWSKNDYYAFLNTFKYEDEKVSLDKYTIIEEDNNIYEIYNWFQYYDIKSLQKELKNSNLEIESVYKDVAGNQYDENYSEFAVVISKI